MTFVRKILGWWRGNTDPALQARVKQMREDMETRRVGAPTGQNNISHGGKDSTGRGSW